MGYCPKCNNEYREGVLFCPDCKCEIVEGVPKTKERVIALKSKHVMDRFVEYLGYSSIPVEVEEKPEEERSYLSCDPKDRERVLRAFSVFVSVETGRALEQHRSTHPEDPDEEQIDSYLADISDGEAQDGEAVDAISDLLDKMSGDEELKELYEEDIVQEMTARPIDLHDSTPAYVPASEKLEDTKSSAIVLLGFGLVGFLAFAVMYFVKVQIFSPYICLVMAGLFAAMFFYGFHSFKSLAQMKLKADEEAGQIAQIKAFLESSLTREDIESATEDEVAGSDIIEHDLLRSRYVYNKLREQFPDADDSLITFMAEQWMSDLYPSENESAEV